MGVKIKEPCTEDWTKMTDTERGAFCQKCAIDVFDFTNKTPIEIKSILSQEFNGKGNVCGRITNFQLDQINDDFYQWYSEKESFRAIWMISLVAVFGLTLFSCNNNLSKEIVSQIHSDATELIQQQDSLMEEEMACSEPADTLQ